LRKLLLERVFVAKQENGTDTMQQYSIHKTGKQYVVRAEPKDLLICESRREAEHIICDVTSETKTRSLDGHRIANATADRSPCANADVLAKVVLDIKLILDIEKALTNELDVGKPRNPQPVQDQIR
jgi:hypothetical protein